MSHFRQLTIAGLLAALLAPAQAMAVPQDAIFNKEGVWAIDADDGGCALSRRLDHGDTFLFRAKDGVTFGFFPRTPLMVGRVGRIETNAGGFDFKPDYVDGGAALFSAADFSAESVAALRRAREIKVLVDGRPVVAMRLEGTGFAAAFDAVIACSKGAKGWWGEGAKPPA